MSKPIAASLMLLICGLACSTFRPDVKSCAATQFWAISAADLEVVSLWYEKNFGFRRVKDVTLPSGGARTCVLQNDQAVLEIVQVPEARALSVVAPTVHRRPLVHGVFKVGFFVEDLEQTLTVLREHGVSFRGQTFEDATLKVRSALTTDPEGNTVQLFERIR